VTCDISTHLLANLLLQIVVPANYREGQNALREATVAIFRSTHPRHAHQLNNMFAQVFRDAMIENHSLRVLSYPLTVHHLIELSREGDRGFDFCHPLPGLNFAENYDVGHRREGAEVRRECDE
jgi:hypothetical protein